MWQYDLPFSSIIISAVAALVPIIWIFVGMLKLRLPSYKAGIVALAIGAVLAVVVWKMPLAFLFQAILEGLMLGLWPILWVIFAALFTYNLLVVGGAMDKIRDMLSGISPDRRVQTLIIAFAFGGFLEATAGFGTAVAIPASILIALGFKPLFASVICLVANTVPVAFGVVGIPVITLGKVTELPLHLLTLYTALQILPFVLILPLLLVALTTGGLKGLKGVTATSIISGAAFGLGQTLVAWGVGPELSAVAGSLLSLAVLILWVRVFPVKKTWYFPGDINKNLDPVKNIGFVAGLKAWSPYIFILVFVLLTRITPVANLLNRYPFELKYLFYKGPGGKPLSFAPVTNPGTIILISAILGGILQGINVRTMIETAFTTLKQILGTTVTVLSIVSLAKLMGYSGMISSIALSLSNLTGSFFPIISPLIGALGTFITGSDTSSNVLFGELQKQTALQINSNPSWIAAANASGATAGKMVSPQSIAIAASATGLSGQEGAILGKTIKYAIIFVALLGILVYVVSALFL